jgi:Icc-related predicted phosphoesterase
MPRATRHHVSDPIFHEPTFGEGGTVLPDPSQFAVNHPSDKSTFSELDASKALQRDVVAFEKSRLPDGEVYPLAKAFGTRGDSFVDGISKSGKIVFHLAGDTGATQAGKKYKNELTVADQLSAESRAQNTDECPAFLYHLGDVVYDFGEKQYYYDQFYDAFRNYARPIFAIPGNHDSFIVPGTAAEDEPLRVFERNFCATAPIITPEARSLHRTAMTQPGVYFTLDAPFVRIIGLFSNSLEDPGMISNEDGKWSEVPPFQLSYLKSQLLKIRNEKYQGAVLIAVHHPPFSYKPDKTASRTSDHGGSPAMLRQIDSICQEAGVYPHAFVSGHAHNYQRYTRVISFSGAANDYEVPFIVCGNGGHNASPLVYDDRGHSQDPKPNSDVTYLESNPAVKNSKLTLNYCDDYNYGYLRAAADKGKISITYHPTGKEGGKKPDTVVVDLGSHRLNV